MSIGSKAKLKDDGTMYIGSNASANGGEPDPDSDHPLLRNYWTINGNSKKSYIAYNGISFHKADQDDSDDKDKTEKPASVYLGTDGISLGKKFSVNNNGQLTANSGKIGGWNISKTTLSAGNIKLNANGSIEGGSSYEWSIGQDGSSNFNNLTAKNTGNIAGWTIKSNLLTGGNMTLNSNGSIRGNGWSISAGGNVSGLSSSGLTIGSGAKIEITSTGTGGLTSGGGYIGGSSGHLGASGGSYSSKAPLIWDNKSVTMQNGAYIGTLSINKAGAISDSGDGGSIFIQKRSIYATDIYSSNFRLGDMDHYKTLNFKDSKSGTAKFSDGGYLKFENGILIGYEAKSDGGLVSFD